ncbi:MAG: quinone-dependent dihydroorotate dehydrogenase [Chloroflexaceae bacterium]|nr:quinone-dependent dihydroorotate dehydrogenase [Chloroflexaceae bacterium]
MMFYPLLRPILFGLTRRDPEAAHTLVMSLLVALSKQPALLWLVRQRWGQYSPGLERTVFGLRFPTPVGLAAGFDKDGVALPALAALGFGFLEIGTVTWHPQPGNPRPRIFRLPGAAALINRMGFNNHGALAMADQRQKTPPLPIPIGISLGKSRRVPLEEAVDDYCASLRALLPYGDFFTVNVSSPNTPGLRSLQGHDQLDRLLAALRQEMHTGPLSPPLLVKVSPDLSDQAMGEVLEVCATHRVSGIIATNTTLVGPGTACTCCEAGGLSGRPLAARARHVVHFIYTETSGQVPIIGVGGIFTPDDVWRMFDAGASLVQVYTGFIYEGPGMVRAINRALTCKLGETRG